ncbi:hypothetical protein AHAS_Ahas09G0030300 [Arachis hypogaea]
MSVSVWQTVERAVEGDRNKEKEKDRQKSERRSYGKEELKKALHNPRKLMKAHRRCHQLHLKLRYMSTRSDPAPEATAAALLMMARTASYVPREFLLPSFSLDFTDSSQEETQTQEGEGQPESQIVTTMCLILNQENIKRFQEEIYCLPLNIVNMAIGNHADGEFL